MEKRFPINRGVALNAINVAGQLAGTNNVLQIASCVKLTFNKNSLTIRSTDTENAMKMSVELGYEVEEKTEICVEKAVLQRALQVIGNDTVDMVVKTENNTLSIVHETGNIDMALMDASLFPTMPLGGESKTFEIPSEVLRSAITDGRNFTLNDNTSPVLCGICVTIKDNTLTFGSTNRITIYKNHYVLGESFGEEMSVVLPQKSIKPIIDICGQDSVVRMSLRDRNAMFTGGSVALCTRLAAGVFPNIDILVNLPRTGSMSVNKAALKEAIKHLSVATGSTRLLTVKIDKESIVITTNDWFLGKNGTERLSCSSSNDIIFGIDGSMLEQALNTVKTANAVIEFSKPDKPIVVMSEDDQWPMVLVAPMTINTPSEEKSVDNK